MSLQNQTAGEPIGLLTVEETAAFLRCSKSALNKWRLDGTGPIFVKVGDRVRYRSRDLLQWVDKHTRSSTSKESN